MYQEITSHMQLHAGRQPNGLTPYEDGWSQGGFTACDLGDRTAQEWLEAYEAIFQEEYEACSELPLDYAVIQRAFLQGLIARQRDSLQVLIEEGY